MSSAEVSYAPRSDATSEQDLSSLANAYRFVLDCHAEKKAVPDRRPDDVERRSDEKIDATASIQRTA